MYYFVPGRCPYNEMFFWPTLLFLEAILMCDLVLYVF